MGTYQVTDRQVPSEDGSLQWMPRSEIRLRFRAVTEGWALSAAEMELTRKQAVFIAANPESSSRDKTSAMRVLVAMQRTSVEAMKVLMAGDQSGYFPSPVTEIGGGGGNIVDGTVVSGSADGGRSEVDRLREKLKRCNTLEEIAILKRVWFDTPVDPQPQLDSVQNGDVIVYAKGTPYYEFRRRELQVSMLEFGKESFQIFQGVPYIHGKHAELMASYLEGFVAKKVRNLLFNVPPSHSKSSWTNVIMPAWAWSTNATLRFAHYTYNDKLGKRDSDWCRDLVKSGWYQHYFPEVQIKFGKDSIESWGLVQGGTRIVTQPGAGMSTGGHPDYIVVDDPCDREGAESENQREALENWLFETMPSRGIARDAGMLVSMQAFHPDDISQRIKAKHAALMAEFGVSPWHLVILPGRFDPALKMVDSGYGGDWRTVPGELLWPELMNEERMSKLERDIGLHATEAQIQQNPKRRDGDVFKVSQLLEVSPDNPLPAPNEFDEVVRAWDRAATEGGGCYTAGVLLGRKGRRVFILDVYRKQVGWEEVEAIIELYLKLDEEKYGFDRLKTYFEREGGSSGKQVADIMVRRLRGHRIYAVGTKGRSKLARADGVTTAISRREVTIVRGPWYSAFIEELSAFGRAANELDKDQVDALALAYNEMVLPSVSTQTFGTGDPDNDKLIASSSEPMCFNPKCNRPAWEESGYCCQCCEKAHKEKREITHLPICNGRSTDWFARKRSGRA